MTKARGAEVVLLVVNRGLHLRQEIRRDLGQAVIFSGVLGGLDENFLLGFTSGLELAI